MEEREREREGGGGRMDESLANWVWFGLNVVLVWLELERDGFGKKKREMCDVAWMTWQKSGHHVSKIEHLTRVKTSQPTRPAISTSSHHSRC